MATGDERKAAAIGELLAGRLADPHSVLGAHPAAGGVVVRAFRPGAEAVRVLASGADPAALERVHADGLWEGLVRGVEPRVAYELEAEYADGPTERTRDPYAFLPTVGALDLHLAGEGRHEELYTRLGAHVRDVAGVTGVSFAVWAPNARAAAVVGDFNRWDARLHPMRTLGASGIWELFVPGIEVGARYKFALLRPDGSVGLKADPYASCAEVAPATASVVHRSQHRWRDDAWLERRRGADPLNAPMSIYEVHLGSWRRDPARPHEPLDYRALAGQLADYAADMAFTHVELLPVMHHPFTGSWGYQVTGYFAPMAAWGDPDGLRVLVDTLHERGIGVILDWVPAHFPKDEWALARFDGTALYEHEDPRRGEHPDWGTLVFNLGRNEVRNFLLASALHWLREYHADGLRVDAVASMLYLDYSRNEGEWVPNAFGGREDLDAVSFLQELNAVVHGREPGVVSAAEESTAWPGVSRPAYLGGLGFGFKWNMGWMHDTLAYFARDPLYRQHHHHELTFSLVYAWNENFVLPLSHDEVVHGKGSLLTKMPGDRWRQFANLRALYAYMWAHPGKQLLFMGGELAQEREWSEERSLDWHLLESRDHAGVQALVRRLNQVYRDEPALWEVDFEPSGFRWLEANDAAANVLAFARVSADGSRQLVCVLNLAPVPRDAYRLGMPAPGRWVKVLDTDADAFGGSAAAAHAGTLEAEPVPWHDQPCSAEVALPPLAAVWFVPEGQAPQPHAY